MHHELEANSVTVLQLIQQCQIAYNILKMIIRTSTIQEEKYRLDYRRDSV